ncbi:MAG: fibronectin type III domain-containing protein [Eubacterium sp.]|nr:fibronectin type III domain-containing protein [Eubacterium sp.]
MKKTISFILALFLILIIPFSAFAQQKSFGYDVSHNNQVINCKEAKESGKNFVMIRLGYSTNHLDRNFWDNVNNACENEMPFGVYFYSYAYNDAEAKEDADFVIETLSKLGELKEYLKLPVVYDLEDSTLGQLGKTQITKQTEIFCDAVLDSGYVPMVYANTYWFENLIDTSVISSKGYKIWYAYYPSTKPDFSSKIKVGSTGLYADMWQYKKGDAPKNILDENIAYDMNDLSHIWKLSKTEKATLSKDGKSIYKCALCDKQKTKTISKIESTALSATSYTYNGKAKKPSVTVKDSKGKTVSKSYYSVAYSNNKNAGKASAKITFKGNYSGSKTLTFKINPQSTVISGIVCAKKSFTVKWKKQATQTTGYQIQYATDKNFSKSKKTLTVSKNKTVSKSITKLSAKKKYYVRIRTYKTVDGKKYYSSWSKAKTVITK